MENEITLLNGKMNEITLLNGKMQVRGLLELDPDRRMIASGLCKAIQRLSPPACNQGLRLVRFLKFLFN